MQVLRRHELQHFRGNLINENRCFVCKRTEAEIQDFLIQQLDSITEKHDVAIADLETKLKNKKDSLKSHLDNILDSTMHANLDIKISFALSDDDLYAKNMSHIRDLIEMRNEFSNCVTLYDVRTRIMNCEKILKMTKFTKKIVR